MEKEAAKTADMKEKGADPYDLKQQVKKIFVLAIASLFPFTNLPVNLSALFW